MLACELRARVVLGGEFEVPMVDKAISVLVLDAHVRQLELSFGKWEIVLAGERRARFGTSTTAFGSNPTGPVIPAEKVLGTSFHYRSLCYIRARNTSHALVP